MAGDTESAESQARGFQDLVAARITQLLEGSDDKERRRLNVQLGTSRALEDVKALRGIINSRDGLAPLTAQLPGHITALTGPPLEAVKAQLDTSAAAKS